MTLYDLAHRLAGEITEVPGPVDHPAIRWFHKLTTYGEAHDEVPWCSSFVNWCAWLLRLPRSKSAAARSWLNVGESVALADARVGWDICIFRRGNSPTAGHVAVFAGLDAEDTTRIRVIGGNQSNGVTLASFPVADLLGVRRLRSVA